MFIACPAESSGECVCCYSAAAAHSRREMRAVIQCNVRPASIFASIHAVTCIRAETGPGRERVVRGERKEGRMRSKEMRVRVRARAGVRERERGRQ